MQGEGGVNGWRDKYKGMEQSFMVLKDQYAEVALALGFEGDAFFGDPLASHKEIVARAAEVAELREQLATARDRAEKYEDLYSRERYPDTTGQ
jgi:hypothetical protein